jgi:redox-sensitive bicupin YhaK (pirin superfamily)
MLDISMPASTTLSHKLPAGHTAFAYVLSGEGEFDQQQNPYSYEVVGHGWSDLERCTSCKPETVVLFEHEGDGVQIRSLEKPLRFLLLSGKPLGEPVAWYGPIVMNSREELRIAFEEYNNGTFVK